MYSLYNIEIISNYRSNLKFSTGYSMEFDLFLPTYQLAIEYQGPQHYNPKHYFNQFRNTQKFDEVKNVNFLLLANRN